jgi:hypothetical protein
MRYQEREQLIVFAPAELKSACAEAAAPKNIAT